MYRTDPLTDRLLISAVSGHVRAHERATGRRVWEYSFADLPYGTLVRIAVQDGCVVLFGARSTKSESAWSADAENGALALLDYATGRPRWEVLVPGKVFSPTLLVEGAHVFLANGTSVAAFAIENGALLWHDGNVAQITTYHGAPRAYPITLATRERTAQGDGQ